MAQRKKRQPGRTSAASLEVVTELQNYRPAAPDHLSDEEKDLWRRVMNSKPPGWWDAGSIPLLKAFVKLNTSVDLIQERIEAVDIDAEDGIGAYNTLTRIRDRDIARASQLATRMRLTQQARFDAQKASVHAKKSPSRKSWEED